MDYKVMYEELLVKYKELQNKYDALKEVYRNEMEINSMAEYKPLTTEAPKRSSKVDPYNGYTEWKEGTNINFNIFEL